MNSARVYIKDKDWKQAEKFLLEALEHPNDKWEAAYHLGDKVYVRSQDWLSECPITITDFQDNSLDGYVGYAVDFEIVE